MPFCLLHKEQSILDIHLAPELAINHNEVQTSFDIMMRNAIYILGAA